MTISGPSVPHASAHLDLRGRVRSDDPMTSWHAAAMQDEAQRLHLRDYVHLCLKAWGPLTHAEVYERYREAGGTRTAARIRHIVKDLVDDGYVERADEKGRSATGNPSTRWRVVDLTTEGLA